MRAGIPLVCSNFGPGDVSRNATWPVPSTDGLPLGSVRTLPPYPNSVVCGKPDGNCWPRNCWIWTVYSFWPAPFLVGTNGKNLGSVVWNFGMVAGSISGAVDGVARSWLATASSAALSHAAPPRSARVIVTPMIRGVLKPPICRITALLPSAVPWTALNMEWTRLIWPYVGRVGATDFVTAFIVYMCL